MFLSTLSKAADRSSNVNIARLPESRAVKISESTLSISRWSYILVLAGLICNMSLTPVVSWSFVCVSYCMCLCVYIRHTCELMWQCCGRELKASPTLCPPNCWNAKTDALSSPQSNNKTFAVNIHFSWSWSCQFIATFSNYSVCIFMHSKLFAAVRWVAVFPISRSLSAAKNEYEKQCTAYSSTTQFRWFVRKHILMIVIGNTSAGVNLLQQQLTCTTVIQWKAQEQPRPASGW